MARPKKYRKICHFPKTLTFLPVGNKSNKETVTLTVDEYETLRLIDKEGRSQEECSSSMKVARTTVQMIYASARKKVAEAIVDGRSLEIEGGDYDLCNGEPGYCSQRDCHKKRLYEQHPKEDGTTRIALALRDGNIAKEMEETSRLSLIDIKDGRILHMSVTDYHDGVQESLPDYLHILHVDELVCGSIGQHDAGGLKEIGIRIHQSECDAAEYLKAYINESREIEIILKGK